MVAPLLFTRAFCAFDPISGRNMTPDSLPSPADARAPRRLWLWLAGLVLAFNALTALPQLPRPDRAEQRLAALTAPVPVNAQFRDPAAAVKAAAQRALKAQDRPDGDPPLVLHHAALVTAPRAATAAYRLPASSASPADRPARPYHARAPPLSA